MWAGDSYLERPGDGWSVVYGLHSITLCPVSAMPANDVGDSLTP